MPKDKVRASTTHPYTPGNMVAWGSDPPMRGSMC